MMLAVCAAAAQNAGPLVATPSSNPMAGSIDQEIHVGEADGFITVTGGIPGPNGYTHSWSKVSGTTLNTIYSPNSGIITFLSGGGAVAVYRDTIHDSAGGTVTVDVTVNIS